MKKVKIQLNSWIYTVTFVTFLITIGVSYITDILMGNAGLIVAVFVVLVIILIGIIFDTVGIAVAAGTPEAFHAMAASKISSAKYSLLLLKNASRVSNILNDVIGDIAGVISGAASAVIVLKIMQLDIGVLNQTVASIILSAMVASLTVGGKAIGKEIALDHSKEIVNMAGRVMCFVNERTIFKFIKNV